VTWSRIKKARKRVGRELDGHLHPDFMQVAAAFQRQIESYAGGGALCIYHRGECVLDLWGGATNEAGDPWQQDTMAPSFSTTKGVASTLIHIMVDRGLLEYEQRVSDVWPEFAQAGKQDITLRQVLSHQSGLYHIRQMIDRADRMLDWEYMVHAIERTEPVHPPGDRTGYHGLTYGYLVGEILQRVTGTSFPELVRTELVEPLGLDGMYIGAPSEVLDRAADLIWPKQMEWLSSLPSPPYSEKLAELGDGANRVIRNALGKLGLDLDFGSLIDALAPRGISTFDFGAPETLQASIPAGNGLFTARSLARMYAALSNGGELDGVRLLSRATLERAIVKQVRAPGLAVLPFDMRWRLGYHGIATTRGFPKQAFGHFGFGGSGAWADPRRELAIGLIVNCGMGTPFGDTRIPRLSGAALTCVRRRSGGREEDAPSGGHERVPIREARGFASQAG
jgi:CubicO group peptidase (beta-lactamase class C family)